MKSAMAAGGPAFAFYITYEPINSTAVDNAINHINPISPIASQKKLDENDSSGDDDRSVVYKDTKSPPRLFIIQSSLRPDTIMQAKLSEALNLTNSGVKDR
ncbi:hypothetical protein AAC387_Pa02g2408 [Persea americana]